MPTFEVEAMVRGYHAYQDSWDALIGEELVCAREPDNLEILPIMCSLLTLLPPGSAAHALMYCDPGATDQVATAVDRP